MSIGSGEATLDVEQDREGTDRIRCGEYESEPNYCLMILNLSNAGRWTLCVTTLSRLLLLLLLLYLLLGLSLLIIAVCDLRCLIPLRELSLLSNRARGVDGSVRGGSDTVEISCLALLLLVTLLGLVLGGRVSTLHTLHSLLHWGIGEQDIGALVDDFEDGRDVTLEGSTADRCPPNGGTVVGRNDGLGQ